MIVIFCGFKEIKGMLGFPCGTTGVVRLPISANDEYEAY